ncbi:50S ribosomal protein L29 [Candidatus Nomurabacteria bacterium RIFCSPLOWO2_01_FULL_40_15]|uniref:Large ribosomal subunit protein uL29 n=1 Tax=Candidatus Nomurabacteria bacterium RIFCSPLOWO2_01_FULL_40_15 TaxID=1801772 RepID=A0A1F6X8T3_9BACT|nr:MAG: 50S ribosomal protein L29 [Candidatus Nomurabacteria bacterium RIFCSPLOWO2_01_FULL_40_15]
MKKTANLKETNIDELSKKLDGLEESLRALRFKAEGAKSKNVKEAMTTRKEIARVLTAINQQKQNAR